ncbi:MAG TPA: hypothetical protein VLH14_00045 [Patescibacteria group bacterium]|nr:hypothetical protein [Patescibacteria group bacterium]
MQKDVIYIDTEDDITAIIGKVRASDHKIVALVPPKRIGAIQSAVNLKLVQRAAGQADKRLVLISSNAALTALAGSANIPVAKNLQSKPEVAEIPAIDIDDGEDVIDGSDMVAPKGSAGSKLDDAIAAADDDLGVSAGTAAPVRPVRATPNGPRAAGSRGIKIPNFDKFRKKLFLIGAAVVLLIGFLVWAIVFAPAAKITITARTSDSSLNTLVKMGDSLTTSLRDGTVKSVTKTVKKDVSVSFAATGTKNVGDKAAGSIVMQVCVSTFPPSTPATIPAGTIVTSAGNQYVTNTAATFSGVGYGNGCANYKSGSVSITASAGGAAYNTSSSASFTVGSNAGVTAQGSASGGTDKNVQVVQQSDVDTVSNNILSSTDNDTAKKSLQDALGSDYVVLDGSFKSDTSAVKPSPAVGTEADSGKGALTGSVTFSMVGVPKKELGTFLDAYFAQQIDGQDNQKVYDNGIKGVSFTNVNAVDSGFTANITTNGKIGPKIDDKALKEYAKSKRFGEIQSYVKSINGVEDVDIKFSPFWVNSAPNDVNKIHVEFKVNG